MAGFLTAERFVVADLVRTKVLSCHRPRLLPAVAKQELVLVNAIVPCQVPDIHAHVITPLI
jgi:hypothetical protein